MPKMVWRGETEREVSYKPRERQEQAGAPRQVAALRPARTGRPTSRPRHPDPRSPWELRGPNSDTSLSFILFPNRSL